MSLLRRGGSNAKLATRGDLGAWGGIRGHAWSQPRRESPLDLSDGRALRVVGPQFTSPRHGGIAPLDASCVIPAEYVAPAPSC